MKSLRQVLILAIAVITAPAVSSAKACLTSHVRAAIQLNKSRTPLYSSLTHGKSLPISKKLIHLERLVLLAAPFADTWAVPYHHAGVNILCDDISDMSLTPAFQTMNREGKDRITNFHVPNTERLYVDLTSLLEADDFQGVAHYADEEIQKLEKTPRYNCLLRHFLETLRRMAILAPRHNELAMQKIKISSLGLSKTVMKTLINALDSLAQVDEMAAPLQAEGIQIICQDVPADLMP